MDHPGFAFVFGALTAINVMCAVRAWLRFPVGFARGFAIGSGAAYTVAGSVYFVTRFTS